jgi:hypothetical protein
MILPHLSSLVACVNHHPDVAVAGKRWHLSLPNP